MKTDMKDIHFASYADRVASHINEPPPAFQLTRWEAFLGTLITFFDARKMATGTVAGAVALALCLGTVGCAGLGTQPASTLTTRIGTEPGLDSLWMGVQRSPAKGIEIAPYAGAGLTLWAERPAVAQRNRVLLERQGGAVEETWENTDPCVSVSAGSLFGDSHDGGQSEWPVRRAHRAARSRQEAEASKGTDL
jgi:hypothetical protein